MNELTFIFQNIIILLVFAVLYELLYRWNNKFIMNRMYLIAVVIVSIIVPLLSFKVFPYDVIVEQESNNSLAKINLDNIPDELNWYYIIIVTGIGIASLIFIFRLGKILHLITNTKFEKYLKYKLSLNKTKSSFSFFNFLYLEDRHDDTILYHEIAHASKLHTLDKLVIEILICILWFNPLIYRFRFYVTENHEFEADNFAIQAKNLSKTEFANQLLNYSRLKIKPSYAMVHDFHSITKNRIIMLTKNSFKSAYFYLLALLAIIIIIPAFSFKSYPVYKNHAGEIVSDTLKPWIIKAIDTVKVFNENTKEYETRIVTSETTFEEFMKHVKFSGKMVESIDSFRLFDPANNEESVLVFKKSYPVEFQNFYNNLEMNQQSAILNSYGRMEKLKEYIVNNTNK